MTAVPASRTDAAAEMVGDPMLAPDKPSQRLARRALPAIALLALITALVAASWATAPRPLSSSTDNLIGHVPAASGPALADGTPTFESDGSLPIETTTAAATGSGPTRAPAKVAKTDPPEGAVATAKPAPAATPKPTPKPTQKPPPAPPPGVHLALGAWAGQPWNVSSLKSFSSLVGGTPGMFMTYLSWPDRAQYVSSDEKAIANLGASHVMTWEPFGMTLKSIVSGAHDSYIRQYAQGAAGYGKRFYIRLMHEMNGDWYPWGRGVGGNTPADFVNAWRHVVDIFDQQGATNVKWVWCPNVRYGKEYPFADLWPGSSYVDWTCLDGYNWGTDPHLGQPAWQSFGTIFGSSYSQIMAIAPGKPMLIGETASTEHGGDKAAWITKTFLTDVSKYPAIKSVVWFNQADGSSDFRVNSSKAALGAFQQVVDSSLWSGTLP